MPRGPGEKYNPPRVESTAWVKDFLESVRDVLWLATVDGSRYLFINKMVETVYGYSQDEFRNNPNLWLEVIHPEDLNRVRQESEELHRSSFIESEYRIVHRDGKVRWLLDKKYVFRDELGKPLRIGGIATDITGQKKALEDFRDEHENLERQYERRTVQLKKAEERFLNLFENAGDPMYTVDPEGVITALNPAWERVTGYKREDWLGKSFVPLVHPEDVADTTRHFLTAMSSLKPVTYESRFRDASGQYRIAEHTLAPQIGIDGELKDVVGIARDLTERKRAEEERLRFEQHIQQAQKLESLGVLTGGIAHDFNNMLSGVVGYTDLALTEAQAGSSLRSHLEKIKASSLSLASMTGQMLAYAGKGSIQKEPVDLTLVIKEMTQLMGITTSTDVDWKFDLKPNIAPVHADPGQVRQLVMNLVTNAADSLEGGRGTISVRTRELRADREVLDGMLMGDDRQEGDYVVLDVSDTGQGIDEKDLPLVFDPFFTTKSSGHGLGLAAVIGILRRHAGAVRIESQPGGGTTFRVLLPCGDPQTVNRKVETEEVLVCGTGTVLIVDDQKIVREMARDILESAGYQVHSADSGPEALQMLNHDPMSVDIVLLDQKMPRMSGTEVLREIRKLREDLPVILSSGYSEQEIESLDTGESAFLQKPYRASALTGTVKRLLSRKGKPD